MTKIGGRFGRYGDDALRGLVGSGRSNPFVNKTAKEIDSLFRRRGFEPRGPDPVNGFGGYVNPRSGRSYHIDPRGFGRYSERNQVDVNRSKNYSGPLTKKKLPYKE